ncbi:MAG: cobalamin B12-binding domain-containing protein [Bacteroidota bacterium]
MNNDIKNKKDLLNRLLNLKQTHKEFLNALIIGEHELCSELTRSYLEKNNSINELYENIMTKAMYDIGTLWEFNKISVATEHMASAIVESIMNQLYYDIISKEKKGKTVIAACVENEFHQIGIKMVSDIFEMNGWDALFLGSNTPTSDLISFIKNKNPDLLAISLSLYFNLPALERMILKMQKEFPGLPILVGGQAFQHGGKEIILNYDNVIFSPDLYSTELLIKSFK